MFYYLDVERQIKRIAKSLSLFKVSTIEECNSTNSTLKDITDGLLYKNILKSPLGDLIKKKEAFTFTINTDGISFSDSSNLSMWSVYLVINEVKPELRFCIENIIVVGTINVFHYLDH